MLDLSVKKNRLFDRVHHIIQTYGGLNLKGLLPWHVIEFSVKKILYRIMLDKLAKDIKKFKGHIQLNESNLSFSETDHNNLEVLLAFDLIDVDEYQDLLHISLPHLNINEFLIDKPINALICEIASGSVTSSKLLDHISGLRILNYDRITRELEKALELSPESVKSIEISKLMIEIKDDLLTHLVQNRNELINSCPLCLVPDKSIALYFSTT